MLVFLVMCTFLFFVDFDCSVSGVTGRITFNCDGSNDLFLPLTCSVVSESGISTDVPC